MWDYFPFLQTFLCFSSFLERQHYMCLAGINFISRQRFPRRQVCLSQVSGVSVPAARAMRFASGMLPGRQLPSGAITHPPDAVLGSPVVL